MCDETIDPVLAIAEESGPSSANLKRKRKGEASSDSESSGPEEEECQLYTKYFVTNLDKFKKSISKNRLKTQPVPKDVDNKPARPRKRKFLYKSEEIAPKRIRKFYYLTENMTKPRKPKQPTIVEHTPNTPEIHPEPAPSGKHKMHFVKTDSKGKLYLAHRQHLKSDLFFNDEKICNYEAFKKIDLRFHIVDEIALEGLDGITIEAFWKRFKTVFPNNISKDLTNKIWRIICNNKRISFYILNEPREKLISFDRCKYMDVDSGVFVEPFVEYKDIYPLESVNDSEIRGSCSTFKTRKENQAVRRFSMKKILELYDQKLVFVADQALRNKALISEEADPNLDLMDIQYCILERIGRSRHQGELTQGKMSLKAINNDMGNLYHNRKILSRNLLVVNQFFYVKSFTSQQNISGGLVHLSRFYKKRKTKQALIMEQVANVLKERPNYQIELSEFRKIFGNQRTINKLMKTPEFRRFFHAYSLPFRKLHPKATRHEYLTKNRSERQVRILRLVDPYTNVTAVLEAKDYAEPNVPVISESPGQKLFNYDFLRDVYLYILSTGKTGATIQEVNQYFKMDFYSVRIAVRKLLLRNVLDSHKIDLGRQQSLKFYARYLDIPTISISTEPKNYELPDETVARVLKGYDRDFDDSVPFYVEPPAAAQSPIETTSVSFSLMAPKSACSVFLTEAVDSISEEQTIFDIVIKGRDRLLLAQSNLLAHYISEFDNFLLKTESFIKSVKMFQNGLGKIIYDFLTSVNYQIETDNTIVFDVDNFNMREAKVVQQFQNSKFVIVGKNFTNPHSNSRHIDAIAKIYLFEAMFDEDHASDRAEAMLCSIFERMMLASGKIRRELDQSIKLEPKIELEVADNVVMEKCMGSKRVLEFSEIGSDGIKTEIFTSTKPVKVTESGVYLTDDSTNLTQRYINRANLMLKLIYRDKIVQDIHTFFKIIRKDEDEEGYEKKVCRKSVDKILGKLVQEGYVKIIKIVTMSAAMTRTKTFVCVPSTDIHHNLIKSTIDQLKLRLNVGSSISQKTIVVRKKIESPFSARDVKDSITELKQLSASQQQINHRVDKNIGKSYGYSPKFVRIRVLHEYLFYVIRELTTIEPLDGRQMQDLCQNFKVKMTTSDLKSLPPLYYKEISWRMFIPPLRTLNLFPKGWALASDIILRMPLSVFVKIYHISYIMPELEAFLKHPIKRHLLLKHLPVSIRHVLFHKRKYIYVINEIFNYLCHIGLLQLGPRNFKEKDQQFIYLNSKTSLYDTCTSKPGYNQVEDKKYKKISFQFNTGSDIELYWSEMWRICINTALGKRKVLDGQYVTIEDASVKPAMRATLKAKTFEQAPEFDRGKLPGDRKGAAGLDSSLWSYVKRNWIWSGHLDAKACQDLQGQVSGLKKEKFDGMNPQPIRYDLLVKQGGVDRKVYLKPKLTLKKPVVRAGKKKKVLRKIVAAHRRSVRQYHDALDREIMAQNRHGKVDWDKEEDQILRFCKMASTFLCPISKKQYIRYNVIRDVLHRLYPKSRNKTASACQRRIYLLMLDDEVMRIMESNISNFLNSDTIAKYFDQIHNRYKNRLKVSDAQLYIAFIYLVAYMYKHKKEMELLLLGYIATVDFFSDPYIALFELILENIDNGASMLFAQPKTIEEIQKSTIKSLVHCSMACKRHSTGWAFQLFHIYKQFPDELIRRSVSELRKGQFLVINKGFDEKSATNSWHIPLKFSYLYNSMKTSTYNCHLFLEAYRKFTTLFDNGYITKSIGNFLAYNELNTIWEKMSLVFEIPEMGVILNPDMEDHGEVIDELSNRFRLYLLKIYEGKNEQSNQNKDDAIVDEDKTEIAKPKDIEEVKADVMRLIFRVPYLFEGKIEEYFKKMSESDCMAEIDNYIHLIVVDLLKFISDNDKERVIGDFVDGIDQEFPPSSDDKLLLKNLSKVVFAIQTLQQMNVGVEEKLNSSLSISDRFRLWEDEELGEEKSKDDNESETRLLTHKGYGSAMDSCIKRAQEGQIPSLDEIKTGMMADAECPESREIPYITDLIMLLTEGRFPELDSDKDTIERMKEHFVMQYPKLLELHIEDAEEAKNVGIVENVLNKSNCHNIQLRTKNNVKAPQLDRIVECLDGGSENAVFVEELVDFIYEKKQLGASGTDIKKQFPSQNRDKLLKVLQVLSELDVILRVGVSFFVYVHYEYRAEWLIDTFALTPEEVDVLGAKEKIGMKKIKVMIEERLKTADPLKVQLKPWTKLDGTLNNEQFNEWLCLIFSHCLDCPNIPFMQLCEQFSYIKPVDVYYLIEILEELACVEICLFNNTSISLLDFRDVIHDERATCLDDFADMYVKVSQLAGLFFGSYLDRLFLN